MRIIINIFFLIVFILLNTCESNQTKNERIQFSPQNDFLGKYRISASGGYGVILNLKDSTNIDYLMWVDVGGYFFGRKGKYHVKKDTLFLTLFHPACRDTHYVRYDTLLIEKWNNINIFKPKFIGDEWYVATDKKTKKIIRGHDCFAKVAELNENYYSSIEIGRWDTLTNKNSIPVQYIYPPLPAMPDTVSKDLELNGFFK